MTKRKAIINIVAVVLIIVLVAAFMRDVGGTLAGGNSLPANLDIAYKEIQLRGIGLNQAARYAVIDTTGYIHFVTEEVFQSLNTTQKIGDCLYRLPDGSLLGGSEKEEQGE